MEGRGSVLKRTAWEALTDKKGGALEEEREGPIQISGGGMG